MFGFKTNFGWFGNFFELFNRRGICWIMIPCGFCLSCWSPGLHLWFAHGAMLKSPKEGRDLSMFAFVHGDGDV